MTEVKARISAIDAITTGAAKFESPMAQEFCYLQLRMICELIALGCLIAHGDITETQTARFQREFSADRIVHMLQPLHDDFYPHPMGPSTAIETGRHHFDEPPADYLSKDELRALVVKCGDAVHRGNARSLLRGNRQLEPLAAIAMTTQRIANLLSIHRIMMAGGNSVMICTLKSARNQAVEVLWAEKSL